MTHTHRRVAVLLGAAALIAPSTALAGPGHGAKDKVAKAEAKGKVGHAKAEAKGKAKVKAATYVLKGVYDAADSSVTVTSGNSAVKRAGLIGDRVAFDFSAAKLTVADTNGDDATTIADVVSGDEVKVQVRLPRTAPGTGPFAARKLVDLTNPAVEEDEVG